MGIGLQVRWVQADAIQLQLDSHNIVLLSNIGALPACHDLLHCTLDPNPQTLGNTGALPARHGQLRCTAGAELRCAFAL